MLRHGDNMDKPQTEVPQSIFQRPPHPLHRVCWPMQQATTSADRSSRKRKNAAAPPPTSDRQTRTRRANNLPVPAPTHALDINPEDPPERPKKRLRPRARVRKTNGKDLEDIAEEEVGGGEGEEALQSGVPSPTKNTETIARILLGMGQVAPGTSQTDEQSTIGCVSQVRRNAKSCAVHGGRLVAAAPPTQPVEPTSEESELDDSEDDTTYSELEESPKRLSTVSRKKAGSSSRQRAKNTPASLPILEVQYQLTLRGERASKIVKMTSEMSYDEFLQRILTEMAIPAHKHEGRWLGIKMPDKRVSEPPLRLTEDQYKETLQELVKNALALDRGKRVNRKIPTVIDLKTFESELAEKEARRSKKKGTAKGKKKANMSDDSDAPQDSDNDGTTGPKKTMTREEATELLHSKRTCTLHKRLCRVMPDGLHVPWSVEAITVWATLICDGQATPDEIPGVLKDDARPRVQESRRASSRDPTPAPPMPIEIKMIYPPFLGSSSVPNAPTNTNHPPSSPTLPTISSSDPFIEDFLKSLDEKWSGKDYRNFLQYLDAFNAEAMIRITELWAKEIRGQGADFYRQAPFKMPRGTANIFFAAVKDCMKTLKEAATDEPNGEK
ncbi:hypothetical protein M407DRAFT_212354 [Tulasnella calospora MUT 4182]|uniref:Uncharacterized protein n=1 Tax=Tulasnella calospora MUT 4182 TaxID=1051891 RepID=A0A0C3QEZ9_9AGAM|nr:hypothetical protein M407DRAFT_212354 [Tulasnella calospora MUT 4182]